MGLLNIGGFYDALIAFNEHMKAVGFVRPQHAGILLADTTLDGLLAQMAAYRPHETILKMKAANL